MNKNRLALLSIVFAMIFTSCDNQFLNSDKISESKEETISSDISSSIKEVDDSSNIESTINESSTDEISSLYEESSEDSIDEDVSSIESSIDESISEEQIDDSILKELTINSTNFTGASFITYVDVVPNLSYPDEFTVTKKTGVIATSSITKIDKLTITVFNTYDNLTVTDTYGNKVPYDSYINTAYTKATTFIYDLGLSDGFKIENLSNSNVYFYELKISYYGIIDSPTPFIKIKGEIDINSITYNKDDDITYNDVYEDKNNLIFLKDGYVKSSDLGNVNSIEIIGDNATLCVYGTNENDVIKQDGIYDDTNKTTSYKLSDGFDGFIIKNETLSNIEIQEIIVKYKEKAEEISSVISIAKAVEIGQGLSRNRGVTADYYTISGTVVSENGSQITIKDDNDSIIAYSGTPVENMHVGYEVTLNGQIQNYYGTVEIVNYTVTSFSGTTYNLELLDSVNGTYTVSKVTNIGYNEKITINLYPIDGYEVSVLKVCNRVVKVGNSNVVTTSITSSGTVYVEFAPIVEKPIYEVDDIFTIYSLEMSGTYGDCTLITYNNYDILIDSGTATDGPNAKVLLEDYVIDGILDLIILSHPDSDHYDGIVTGGALDGVDDVLRLITNNNHKDTEKIKSKVSSMFPNVIMDTASELTSEDDLIYTIDVDDYFSIDILYNQYYAQTGKNNASIPAIINYKNTKVFMGGDMQQAACTAFIEMYPGLFSEDDFIIFKGLHHGSNGSNKDDFLDYLMPDMAFVSAPLKTSGDMAPNYNTHPYLEAMIRIGQHTPLVYWAGICGTLTIECDGFEAYVSGDTRTRDYKYDGKIVDREDEDAITYFESYWYINAIETQNAPDFAGVFE